MGSGVTIGEAIKLGCRVIGRDINPVAVTIVEAALSEYSVDEVNEEYTKIEKQIKNKVRSIYSTLNRYGTLSHVLYYFNVKYLNCPKCKKEIYLFKNRIFSKNAVTRKDPSARSICPSCGSINHIIYDNTSVYVMIVQILTIHNWKCPRC